ncbi:hypothetical protein WME89_19220 [Sorangium sp. So ce321]|uniref:hypothetical protein n=1 Tax=Sorangium sp. So ce321 TaxID=3133300 RepID=UPI003F638DB2
MATLQIKVTGSLGDDIIEFAASQYGHAHAVNEAIAYLTRLQMKAIASDHASRDKGEEAPKMGWEKKDFMLKAK